MYGNSTVGGKGSQRFVARVSKATCVTQIYSKATLLAVLPLSQRDACQRNRWKPSSKEKTYVTSNSPVGDLSVVTRKKTNLTLAKRPKRYEIFFHTSKVCSTRMYFQCRKIKFCCQNLYFHQTKPYFRDTKIHFRNTKKAFGSALLYCKRTEASHKTTKV